MKTPYHQSERSSDFLSDDLSMILIRTYHLLTADGSSLIQDKFKTPPPSEESPLLPSRNNDAVYRRFSDSRKRGILILVSWVGLLPCMFSI